MNENLSAQQHFVTQISPSIEGLPSFEILSLPGYHRPEDLRGAVRDFAAGLTKGRRGRLTTANVDKKTIGPILDALLRSAIDANAVVRSRTRPSVDALERRYGASVVPEYVALLSSTQIPMMRSPISGSSLAKLAAFGGIGVLASLHDVSGQQIALYFLLLGGTTIVLGAAGGVSEALKQGLSHHLLKWMKVPSTGSGKAAVKNSPRKKPASKTPAARKAPAKKVPAKKAPAVRKPAPAIPPAKKSTTASGARGHA